MSRSVAFQRVSKLISAVFAAGAMLALPQAASALPDNPCTVMAVQYCTTLYPRGSAEFLSCQSQIENTCPFTKEEPPSFGTVPFWCWKGEVGLFYC